VLCCQSHERRCHRSFTTRPTRCALTSEIHKTGQPVVRYASKATPCSTRIGLIMLLFVRARLFPRDPASMGLFAMPKRPAAFEAVYVDGPSHVLVLADVATPRDVPELLKSAFPGARHIEIEERRSVRALGTLVTVPPSTLDEHPRAEA
jgi:hypothetical protein